MKQIYIKIPFLGNFVVLLKSRGKFYFIFHEFSASINDGMSLKPGTDLS